ncbi:efflux transporter outer membrane subunit [Zymomonas mobilis]|uniref:RND efflux system, outer membrane lipoprotein, NodT family n=2 Tax=Zymomonas mobilis TaxID=542 RepID=A0A0H3G0D6_ZYMMA|nr:efflux transporter outer membrane subunit [Zymomonas mobilis]AEH63413.1 RND efflux system, outer membrane lipoprotein, NodT family [Zymomonas mobilis subsp. mobilis ATCC 10988]TQL26972.1 NodT family efflux transporter outer membrane factor (OMF) lipoprotein [Zymomonas mobilis]TQL30619.1 NodT family efflux transporter outer membrane factor (OMF) lipoprotein [Zymomonas mobilis]
MKAFSSLFGSGLKTVHSIQSDNHEEAEFLAELHPQISRHSKIRDAMRVFLSLKSDTKLTRSCRSHYLIKASPITAAYSQTEISTPCQLEISGQPQIGNSMKAFSLLPSNAENTAKASSFSLSEVENITKSSSLPSSTVGNIEKSSCLLSSKVGNTVKTSSLCLSKMRKTATAIEKTAKTLSLSPSDVAATEGLSSSSPMAGKATKATLSSPLEVEKSATVYSLSAPEVGAATKATASSPLEAGKVMTVFSSLSPEVGTSTKAIPSSRLEAEKATIAASFSSSVAGKDAKATLSSPLEAEKIATAHSLSVPEVGAATKATASSPLEAGKAMTVFSSLSSEVGTSTKAIPSSRLEAEKATTASSFSSPVAGKAAKATLSSPLEAEKSATAYSLSVPEVGKTTKVISSSSFKVRKSTKAFFLSSSEIRKSVKALFLLPPLALVLAGCEVGPDYVRPSAPTPHQYSGADNNKVTNIAGNRGATGATLSSSKAASDPKKSADPKSDQKKSATENNPPLPPDQITPSGQKISWQEAQPMDRQIKDRWWELFNDPELNKLIERSDVASQSVAQAEATWRNALAVMGQNRSSMWPSISLSASNQHTVTGGGSEVVNTAGGGSSTVSRSNISDNYRAGLSMSWTPDFFGGVRRQIENSRATAEANMADIETARLALHAGVASSYLQLREADAEIAVMEQTIAAYTHALEVARNRFNAGIAPESDVFQAETQLSNTRSQIESLRQNRRTYEDAISVYVGIPAGDFHIEPRNDWSPVVPDVPLDLPSTLLQRRPDIASAERKIEAASATIGVRKAAFYPSFSMSPYAGDTAGDITRLLAQSSSIWSVGASMAFTVLDWGSHLSQLHQARAAYSQAVANYRQVVLQAYQNVADEIAATQIYGNQETHLNDAFKNADRSEQATLKRYQVGLVAYTDVVTVETSALSAKRSLMQTQLARQTAAVSLIQALGGGWTGLPPRMPPNHKVFHEAKKQRLADEKAEKAIAEKQKTRS